MLFALKGCYVYYTVCIVTKVIKVYEKGWIINVQPPAYSAPHP